MSHIHFRRLALVLALTAGSCARPQSSPVDSGDALRPATGDAATKSDVALGAEPPENPHFVDVAGEAGLDRVLLCGGPEKNHILESTGSGCALIDYDEDGLLDVFLVNAWSLEGEPLRVAVRGRSALYRNLGGGRFEDVTDAAGIPSGPWGCGVCAADYDNDGHVDLLITNFGSNTLLRNRGNGTFEDRSQAAGLAESGWGAGAAFFDADGDGWLDLYIARYIDCTFDEVLLAERTNIWRDKVKVMAGPFGLRGDRDRFYRNCRDGTFVEATEAAGLDDISESYGLGVAASDLDNDGDVDIYVANDSNVNFLHRNDGQGHFSEIGAWSGAGVSAEGKAQAGMGVDAADFDGDGLQDLLVTNFAKDYATFYHNDGDLFFTDASARLRLKEFTYETVKWGCAMFDFDQDGDLDIVILNGHIYPQVDLEPSLSESYRSPPTLLRNDGGRLVDVSRVAGPGMQVSASARGLAVGDFDNDGDLDLLATAIDSPPLLLRNDTASAGHWLKLRLLNHHGSPAINARAWVTAAGKTQLREVRSGSTYASQSALELHFGLGSATEIEQLEVVWPGGQRTIEKNLQADGTLTLREPVPGRAAAAAPPNNEPNAAAGMVYVRQIKPIFDEHCIKCHGAKKQESGLRLDSAAAVERGGESGQAIVPGNSAESLLIKAVLGSDEVSRMPAQGDPLEPAQIELLKSWIDQGAEAPDDEPKNGDLKDEAGANAGKSPPPK